MGEPVGFTAVYCGLPACPQGAGGSDCADDLRAAIRSCPHGLLVRTGCALPIARRLAGSTEPLPSCSGCSGAGTLVVVQPCDENRWPTGPAVVAGPLHEQQDTVELRDWLVNGVRRGAPLPTHLHANPFTPVDP